MQIPARLRTVLTALFALTVAVPALVHADAPRLPWRASESAYVTQDCNEPQYDDHVGVNGYAWDFARLSAFDVVAPRAGTVVHVKMSSHRGGADRSAVDAANYLVIDHGDGTYSVMLHLAYGSLDPNVHCGTFVRAGQRLAVTGATGWASGNHLHYQVNHIPAGMGRTCECGTDGMSCGENEAHWDLFWPAGAQSGTVPVQFADWRGASVCGGAHEGNVLRSNNTDAREEVLTVRADDAAHVQTLRGEWHRTEGGVSGGYLEAQPNTAAAARVSLDGLIHRPGTYEVWVGVPARGRDHGVSAAEVQVSGARNSSGHATLAQNVTGGGYHKLDGRYVFSGHAGEALVLSADARGAQSLALDNVVLRRVGDASGAGPMGPCENGGACLARADHTTTPANALAAKPAARAEGGGRRTR